jgi:hypothetical protein
VSKHTTSSVVEAEGIEIIGSCDLTRTWQILDRKARSAKAKVAANHYAKEPAFTMKAYSSIHTYL